MRKSQGTSKTKKKTPARKKGAARKSRKKEPVNMAEVRENINNMVGESAPEIAMEVIETAKKGALASAKYLFEVAGLYPATEETAAKPESDSLAKMLMDKLGGPAEPVVESEREDEGDGEAEAVVSGEKVSDAALS